jgi:hypothetical protein
MKTEFLLIDLIEILGNSLDFLQNKKQSESLRFILSGLYSNELFEVAEKLGLSEDALVYRENYDKYLNDFLKKTEASFEKRKREMVLAKNKKFFRIIFRFSTLKLETEYYEKEREVTRAHEEEILLINREHISKVAEIRRVLIEKILNLVERFYV